MRDEMAPLHFHTPFFVDDSGAEFHADKESFRNMGLKWSYWPLKFYNFFSWIIKTVAAHDFWKPGFSVLFLDLSIFKNLLFFIHFQDQSITHHMFYKTNIL